MASIWSKKNFCAIR